MDLSEVLKFLGRFGSARPVTVPLGNDLPQDGGITGRMPRPAPSETVKGNVIPPPDQPILYDPPPAATGIVPHPVQSALPATTGEAAGVVTTPAQRPRVVTPGADRPIFSSDPLVNIPAQIDQLRTEPLQHQSRLKNIVAGARQAILANPGASPAELVGQIAGGGGAGAFSKTLASGIERDRRLGQLGQQYGMAVQTAKTQNEVLNDAAKRQLEAAQAAKALRDDPDYDHYTEADGTVTYVDKRDPTRPPIRTTVKAHVTPDPYHPPTTRTTRDASGVETELQYNPKTGLWEPAPVAGGASITRQPKPAKDETPKREAALSEAQAEEAAANDHLQKRRDADTQRAQLVQQLNSMSRYDPARAGVQKEIDRLQRESDYRQKEADAAFGRARSKKAEATKYRPAASAPKNDPLGLFK